MLYIKIKFLFCYSLFPFLYIAQNILTNIHGEMDQWEKSCPAEAEENWAGLNSLLNIIHRARQGTSSQYQYCYLDLVIWYWDECGNPSGRGCKKSIGQIKSLLGLQFHRKRQISPPSYMNIASLLQFFTQVSNNSLK